VRIGDGRADYFDSCSETLNCWMHWRLKRAPCSAAVPVAKSSACGQRPAGVRLFAESFST
jgi:hypothetical protein